MKKLFLLPVFTVSFVLVGCGGSGSGGENGSSDTAAGQLLVPLEVTTASANPLSRIRNTNGSCENIPAGYSALASTNVDFLDADGQVLGSTTTDSCGAFTAPVSQETVAIKATNPNYRDLTADVSIFTVPDGGVASTIPAAADYQIASMQFTGDTDDSVAFTITDTETNTAVIGIPVDAFSATINANPVTLTNIQTAAQSSDPASVSLVLDSSGSMTALVYDENSDRLVDANDNAYNRYRLTALAAHTYLDNMPSVDEASITIFSSDVFLMNDATIANELNLVDASSEAVNYTYSEDGFTSNPSDLRLVVDAYNRDSELYAFSGAIDLRHPDTPDVTHSDFYPFSGVTSLYDAIEESLINIEARDAERKIIIAMSDGGDNSSSINQEQVVESAVAKSIPVHTIAFGGADISAMESIALGTNASFYEIQDADLASIFQTIQTGIIFQYLAGYGQSVNPNDELNLTLNINGLTTSRSITK